jgi:hypothetical protein
VGGGYAGGNPRCMTPSLKAPYIQDAGPDATLENTRKYHGAVQYNHGAIGAGDVQKGQNVKSFQTRFILC